MRCPNWQATRCEWGAPTDRLQDVNEVPQLAGYKVWMRCPNWQATRCEWGAPTGRLQGVNEVTQLAGYKVWMRCPNWQATRCEWSDPIGTALTVFIQSEIFADQAHLLLPRDQRLKPRVNSFFRGEWKVSWWVSARSLWVEVVGFPCWTDGQLGSK
jgi:hypothetical protein